MNTHEKAVEAAGRAILPSLDTTGTGAVMSAEHMARDAIIAFLRATKGDASHDLINVGELIRELEGSE